MVTLIAYIPNLDRFFYDWIKKYPGCNILLISDGTMDSMFPKRIKNRKSLPAEIILDLLKNQKRAPLSRVSIVDEGLFYLRSAIMPDDKIHRRFAERFYGREHMEYVSFVDIWSEYSKEVIVIEPQMMTIQ